MQEQLTDVTANTLEQISLSNPILALLLSLLIATVVLTITMIIRLNKKIEAKNAKLYEDAKADFRLILAFEHKLESFENKLTTYSAKNNSISEDLSALKLMLGDVRDILFKK